MRMAKLSLTSYLFQSRLARQVATWVFFGIITIEGIIFVPAYGRRRAVELQKLETVSQEVLMTVKVGIMGDVAESSLLKQIQLQENSLIKGIALYDGAGHLIDSSGERPAFGASSLQSPEKSLLARWVPAAAVETAVRQITNEGTRYDVAWPSSTDQIPYIIAIRHDATSVQRDMRSYALGIAGLVVIISAFVTLVTLVVLQRIVIRPLLLLRDDLSVVGEAIAQGQTPAFSLQRSLSNELGDVAIAFERMFERIRQEIYEREEAEADLRLAQMKSDRLLLNILPAAIATQLKETDHQGAIAHRFEAATILFADIVNFTRIAAGTGPTALVCQLNEIFSAFDAIAERYHLEKIKTIGDAYMVVGGVPSPTDDHAQAIMAMAIEMMQFAQNYWLGDRHLCLRIGINTGPVVAGVIGTKKFSYDLWGDAVNIASRMESHGIANRIQVSEETYRQLKDIYAFEDRGYLQIKGRGEMRAFLLAFRADAPMRSLAQKWAS